MAWDQIEGGWKQLKGKVRERWGKLTDDDIDVIAGKRDQLLGKLQQRYGWVKDEAERHVAEFEERFMNETPDGMPERRSVARPRAGRTTE
jgi:uncharacterized protein YjbJ (UPF0337 family)